MAEQQEEQLVYHVVSWAPDGHRTYHLIVDTLEKAVLAVQGLAAHSTQHPGEEADWKGRTFQFRGWSGCRPWVQIYVGGRQATREEQAERTGQALRGIQTSREAWEVLNDEPHPGRHRGL